VLRRTGPPGPACAAGAALLPGRIRLGTTAIRASKALTGRCSAPAPGAGVWPEVSPPSAMVSSPKSPTAPPSCAISPKTLRPPIRLSVVVACICRIIPTPMIAAARIR
jgi:hypothetical protein